MQVKPRPIRYTGGKAWLVPHIIYILETTPADCYVEPFFGSGAVFFNKKPHPKEIVNDYDQLLYHFYKAIQDKKTLREALRMLYFTPRHRRFFLEAAHTLLAFRMGEPIPPAKLIASVVLYTELSVVKSMTEYRLREAHTLLGFGPNPSRISIKNRFEGLRVAHERLLGALIECRDALEVIRDYDTPNSFFYLDPPYHKETIRLKRKDHYFSDKLDHEGLVNILLTLKGKAILSCYDHPVYHKLLEAGWVRRQFRRKFTQFNRAGNKCQERIETIYLSPNITGYQSTLFG